MKILSLHCDYIKFKPLKKALKQPEELSEERKREIKKLIHFLVDNSGPEGPLVNRGIKLSA